MPTEEEIQKELAGLTQQKLEALVDEATHHYHVAANARYRILSFSESPANAHLWEVYGDNFSGICLEFFVDPMLGSCFEVQYSDEIRALDITANEGFDALVQTVLVKTTQWRPEAEYRLVLEDPPIEDDPPLVQQRLQFPERLLTGIVVGGFARKDEIDDLLNVARFRSSELTASIAYRTNSGNVEIRRLKR